MTLAVSPVLVKNAPEIFYTRHLRLHAARVILALVAMTAGFTAVIYLPLADVTALTFAKSIFVTIFAVWFLAETADRARWLAVLLGFVGVLVMVKPGAAGLNIFALLAVLSAASAAGVMVLIRRIAQTDRPTTILAYQAIFVGPVLRLSRLASGIDRELIDRLINGLAWAARQVAGLDAWFDRTVVDGLVNATGRITWNTGLEFRRLQTGRLRQYVMFIVVGTVAIFVLATVLFRTSLAG